LAQRGGGRPLSGSFGPAALLVLAGAAPSLAQISTVYLQWWENRWNDMEHRTPDFFMAGYGALWLPPISKAGSTNSAGYDVWDRFDLGSPTTGPTAYGTENDFRAVVGELHAANALVNIDIVMNHNGARQGSAGFQAAGGYPGFWMAPANPPVDKTPTSNWGDFHNGNSSGYYQSHDPGGANYDLYRGDLVSLVDIAQESNFQFIRQPVDSANPQNIPAGTTWNKPDAANYRCYPDRQLPPFVFTNPGTSRNPGSQQFTMYPFNTASPMAGDPVTDNTTGMLMRWTQWTLDELKVDGFRLDAVKHTPSWFWDTYWDAAVYQRRTTAWGAKVTPYSFGECVENNSFTYGNFVRKDGFGNRDCLDINGSGALRDVLNGAGLGSWQNAINNHLDNADDGLNNGTLGVNHVFSHDNGTTGDGASAPANPSKRQQGYPENAYVLMRTGPAIVYYNARGVTRPGGFWPKHGVPIALGTDPTSGSADPTLTRLVQLHNWYGRGEFNLLNSTDPVNQSLADVLVFERRKNQGGGSYSANVLVGVNDRFDAGVQQRSVLTSFPAGTRLQELTGAASNPQIDPGNQIPAVLTVGADRRVLLTIPNNVSSAGEHDRGYVVYGPAVPAGTLSVTNAFSTIAADPASAPASYRRTTAVPVVSTPAFSIALNTTAADALDPNTDDGAVFRIDQGYVDSNGNGSVDKPPTDPIVPGYENFLTVNQPLYGSAGSSGQYVQNISTAQLAEGFHYISVIAFRHREANTDALFREFRQVIYVDRQGPGVQWLDAGSPINANAFVFRVKLLDRTATRVHFFWDLDPQTNPVPLCNAFNQGFEHDRFEWRKTLSGLSWGDHSLTLVAFEESGTSSVTRYDAQVTWCYANCDGSNTPPILNVADFTCFLQRYAAGDAYANCDGSTTAPVLNVADFTCFLQGYASGAGCQ
jgi:alpha-amylase